MHPSSGVADRGFRRPGGTYHGNDQQASSGLHHYVRRQTGFGSWRQVKRGAQQISGQPKRPRHERQLLQPPQQRRLFVRPRQSPHEQAERQPQDQHQEQQLQQPLPTLGTLDLPDLVLSKYHAKKITQLFQWQRSCLAIPGVLQGTANLVYTAPTSAGKSMVAEILMAKHLYAPRGPDRPPALVMAVVPYIALVSEKLRSFSELFGGPEKNVPNARVSAARIRANGGRAVKGFCRNVPVRKLDEVDVAVCTPEKANLVLRELFKTGAFGRLSMVMVDEMHVMGQAFQGDRIEALLTKLVYLSKRTAGHTTNHVQHVQLVCCSATLPNLDQVAEWLGAVLHQSTDDERPIKLVEHLVCAHEAFIIQRSRNRLVPVPHWPPHMRSVVDICSGAHMGPTLAFCFTKVHCKRFAHELARRRMQADTPIISARLALMRQLVGKKNAMPPPTTSSSSTAWPCCVLFGVAVHHGGLLSKERELVEGAFLAGVIDVVFATSTLAAGVNLPAQSVVIDSWKACKDTAQYKQMVGRAGRSGLCASHQGASYLVVSRNAKDEQRLVLNQQPKMKSMMSGGLDRLLLEVLCDFPLPACAAVPDVLDFMRDSFLAHTGDCAATDEAVLDALAELWMSNFVDIVLGKHELAQLYTRQAQERQELLRAQEMERDEHGPQTKQQQQQHQQQQHQLQLLQRRHRVERQNKLRRQKEEERGERRALLESVVRSETKLRPLIVICAKGVASVQSMLHPRAAQHLWLVLHHDRLFTHPNLTSPFERMMRLCPTATNSNLSVTEEQLTLIRKAAAHVDGHETDAVHGAIHRLHCVGGRLNNSTNPVELRAALSVVLYAHFYLGKAKRELASCFGMDDGAVDTLLNAAAFHVRCLEVFCLEYRTATCYTQRSDVQTLKFKMLQTMFNSMRRQLVPRPEVERRVLALVQQLRRVDLKAPEARAILASSSSIRKLPDIAHASEAQLINALHMSMRKLESVSAATARALLIHAEAKRLVHGNCSGKAFALLHGGAQGGVDGEDDGEGEFDQDEVFDEENSSESDVPLSGAETSEDESEPSDDDDDDWGAPVTRVADNNFGGGGGDVDENNINDSNNNNNNNNKNNNKNKEKNAERSGSNQAAECSSGKEAPAAVPADLFATPDPEADRMDENNLDNQLFGTQGATWQDATGSTVATPSPVSGAHEAQAPRSSELTRTWPQPRFSPGAQSVSSSVVHSPSNG